LITNKTDACVARIQKTTITGRNDMRMILAAAAALALTAGVANAQSPSTADKPAAAGQNSGSEKMSPGTAGAMQNEAGGVATSPQDVQKQGTGATTPSTDDSGKAMKSTGDAHKSTSDEKK
jgi:hypothetical protein